jgi:phosphotransferase system IIB component
VAITRLRVVLEDARRIDEQALERAGASGVMRVSDRVVHVIVGEDAAGLAGALSTEAAPTAAR